MESPLTTFLYVLLRDHLPAETVRWMVQQAQLPGDPAVELPEIETLAERLANQLRNAPERNGAESSTDGDGNTPIPPEPGSLAEELAAADSEPPELEEAVYYPPDIAPGLKPGQRAEASLTDRWAKASQLASAANLSVYSMRPHLQRLVRAGVAEAKGATASRRYRRDPAYVAPLPKAEKPKTKRQRSDEERQRVAAETIKKTVAYIEEHGRCRPGDLDQLGYSSGTRARVIARLRDEGKVKIDYEGTQRMLVWIPEDERTTSESGHDDAGKGDVPADPAGETGVGERQPEEAASPSAGAIVDSDDDGGQPDAPDAAATEGPIMGRTGSRAKGDEETDVELMARIGDYISENEDQDVWPGEIEAVFGIDGPRRRQIIGMLTERSRVEVIGSGGPTVHYRHFRAPNAGDYRIHEGDNGPANERGLRTKKPTRQERVEPTREEMARVKGWALGARTFRKRAAQEAFPHLDSDALGKILLTLCNEKVLEMRGGGTHGATSYAVVDSPLEAETLEGRVVGWLTSEHVPVERIARGVGASPEAVEAVVTRLVGEGTVVRSPAGEIALV